MSNTKPIAVGSATYYNRGLKETYKMSFEIFKGETAIGVAHTRAFRAVLEITGWQNFDVKVTTDSK